MNKYLMRFVSGLAVLVALSSTAVQADDHVYTEGVVMNVSQIRTVYGKFDDYMAFLDSIWKKEQEAAKKAGYILDYKVVYVEPRSENDPDLLLIVTYKNWAALDGGLEKSDAIAKLIEGSIAASNQGAVNRGTIRRILGSTTMQVLDLK